MRHVCCEDALSLCVVVLLGEANDPQLQVAAGGHDITQRMVTVEESTKAWMRTKVGKTQAHASMAQHTRPMVEAKLAIVHFFT